jgi:hypothetical protein
MILNVNINVQILLTKVLFIRINFKEMVYKREITIHLLESIPIIKEFQVNLPGFRNNQFINQQVELIWKKMQHILIKEILMIMLNL